VTAITDELLAVIQISKAELRLRPLWFGSLAALSAHTNRPITVGDESTSRIDAKAVPKLHPGSNARGAYRRFCICRNARADRYSAPRSAIPKSLRWQKTVIGDRTAHMLIPPGKKTFIRPHCPSLNSYRFAITPLQQFQNALQSAYVDMT